MKIGIVGVGEMGAAVIGASALQAAKFSAFGTDVDPVVAARSSAAMMGVMIPPRQTFVIATAMPAA